MRRQRGASWVEVLTVLALGGLALSAAAPGLVRVRADARTGAAARHVATTLQAMRWKSVARGRGHGLLFERDPTGWHWVEVRDGNGNGLRVGEVRDGVDRVVSGPHRLGDVMSGIDFGFPGTGPFPRIPPRRGAIRAVDDPIRFGRSELIAFSARGQASSGTLYLSDGRRTLYAVVLFGPSCRVRVWRFAPGSGRWTL